MVIKNLIQLKILNIFHFIHFHCNETQSYPILGNANYTQIAPPKSYINVKDFKSPKHLAHYLNYLIENHTAYEEYFLWKEYFQVHGNTIPKAMCQLCESLNR